MGTNFNNFEIYLCNDQPTVCPLCGLRTDILRVENTVEGEIQKHQCPNNECSYEFIVLCNEDFYK